jgi:hypothetical protein
MQNITFISTVHEEIGKCNSDELHKIIEKISPEVVFLEALDDTYSNYEQYLFSSWGTYHRKLEIKAIQKYCSNTSFVYVPVLDSALFGAFDKKSDIICKNIEFQKLLCNFQSLASELGFKFLNSTDSIRLYEEMTNLGNSLLSHTDLNKAVDEDIEAYENSMLQNIASYCRNNQFNRGIFMCGVAHRKSILEKVSKFNSQEEVNVDWMIYNGFPTQLRTTEVW